MPIVINNGGDIRLPMVTLLKGATLVDQGAWANAKRHPGVKAFLASGRLEIPKTKALTGKPAPQETQVETLPEPAAGIPSPPPPRVLLSEMNAKEAIDAVATMDADEIALAIEVETRKTVIKALEERSDQLAKE